MAEDQNRSYQDKFMLRLPKGMRDTIRALADGLGISMNAQIVHMLEVGLEAVPELYREIDQSALEIERLNTQIDGLQKLVDEKQATIDALKTSEADMRKQLSGISDSVNSLFAEYQRIGSQWEARYVEEKRRSEVYQNAVIALSDSIRIRSDVNAQDMAAVLQTMLTIARAENVDVENIPVFKALIENAKRQAEKVDGSIND